MDANNLVPPSSELIGRIESLQGQLRVLRRLLRIARDAERVGPSRAHAPLFPSRPDDSTPPAWDSRPLPSLGEER
jgi:hypothetical protein